MHALGATDILSLSRSAWAGSQRYGTAVWSGDTQSTWGQMRQQLAAGLNMQMSGIVWWTFDTGGFSGGVSESDEFRELLMRWMSLATFMPIMRMHGIRACSTPHPAFQTCPNEPWSFGPRVYALIRRAMHAREALRPYLHGEMAKASASGRPLNRPLFFDFPDARSAAVGIDQFMCGDDIMIAPQLYPGADSRAVRCGSHPVRSAGFPTGMARRPRTSPTRQPSCRRRLMASLPLSGVASPCNRRRRYSELSLIFASSWRRRRSWG